MNDRARGADADATFLGCAVLAVPVLVAVGVLVWLGLRWLR